MLLPLSTSHCLLLASCSSLQLGYGLLRLAERSYRRLEVATVMAGVRGVSCKASCFPTAVKDDGTKARLSKNSDKKEEKWRFGCWWLTGAVQEGTAVSGVGRR